MKHAYFENLEDCSDSTEIELNEVIRELAYDARGLLPVIAQDATSKEVLMLAWMNEATLTETLETGYVTYWSRSRNQRWVKGKTSGHTQELVSLSIDCDGDTVLCEVNQKGVACHTGRSNCFYLQVDRDKQKIHVINSRPTSVNS